MRDTLLKYDEAARTIREIIKLKSKIYEATKLKGIYIRSIENIIRKANY